MTALIEKEAQVPSPPPSHDDAGVTGSDTESGATIHEAALLRKLDLRLLPAVGILYLLSFLDRSNVGNAKIEGLAKDVGMTGNQYLTGLTLYFIGYVLFEVPSIIVLKKTLPQIYFPAVTFLWGVVSTLLGVVSSLPGFFVARFFLGVAECGLFPGVVFYFSMWYRRRERQYRVSLFFGAAALAGSFGGILAYGIGFMRGIVWKNGWHWIFILEGLFTVVVAAASYFFIPNYPHTSSFLSPKERDFIHRRLAADSDATHDERFSWPNVVSALKDPKCWLYGLAFHTTSLPLYTFSLFLPTIIASLGYKAADAQLLTIPTYAFAFVMTVAVAVVSERSGVRAPFIIGSALFGAIGYAILLGNTNPVHRPGVSYVGTFFAAGGIYAATALTLSWPAINVSGQTKRAVANGMQISIGNLGAVLGTQLYRANDGPRYILGHSFALAYLVGNAIVAGLLWYLLKKENDRRDATGIAVVEDIGDLTDWAGDSDGRWRYHY